MPAAPSKRQKGVKISRQFLIGNEAHNLPYPGYAHPAPENHTKGWKVFVRPLPNGPDMTTWLKKVQFKLHFTYADASRTIEAPGPFEVMETGYGEFDVEIRLYFAQESSEKAVYRSHFLQLQPYGTEEQKARQEKENKVVSERLETVEFNEPTTEFYRSLTSEGQFDWLKTKKGRGKGKQPTMVFEGDVEPSAQLPERPPDGGKEGAVGYGGQWSVVYERQVVAELEQCKKRLEKEIEEETKLQEARRRQMQEVGEKIAAK